MSGLARFHCSSILYTAYIPYIYNTPLSQHTHTHSHSLSHIHHLSLNTLTLSQHTLHHLSLNTPSHPHTLHHLSLNTHTHPTPYTISLNTPSHPHTLHTLHHLSLNTPYTPYTLHPHPTHTLHTLHTPYTPYTQYNHSHDRAIPTVMKKQLMDVVQRGPLATIDELEKDLIWRFRFDRFYYHLERSIPVTVHCEGTVEAISMGFEHCTSSALNFTLNSTSRLFCPRTRSRGCVNAHARQLIGERERSQLDV